MPPFNTVPGLVPLKIYSGSTLLTTNVNLINFTGSGVTTTVNAFNGLTVNIGGGGTTVNTGSLLKTASFSNPNLTFTKGDGSTFNVNLVTLVPNTASYANNALSASYAANGGVTQLLAGPNITLGPTNGLGQVTITATLSGSTSFNTATGSYGSFYDTTTQTNVASTPRSMSLNTTDISNGVSISGSTNPYNTYIKVQNPGVYDIQFSAQVDKTDSGTDEIWIWIRKNGSDISDSATSLQLVGNGAHYVAAWNFFVNAAANDYYQLMWYSPDANVRLHAEPAFGVVPGIPSLIVTVNRVDQFLSNTGSFSGSFNGNFTGSLLGTSSFASTASYINPLTQSVLISGSLTVGNITASAYSGLPNDYLYATRSGSSQTVVTTWANTDIIFNNNVVSKGIAYDTGTGIASLTGGKVYRITARLAWGAASVYNLQYSCYDSTNTQIGPSVEIVQSTNGTNNISDGALEFIYAPVSNIDIKIRTTGATSALSGENIRADLNTQFIIQQIA